MTHRLHNRVIPFALMIVVALLAATHLAKYAYWDDESFVAFSAKTLLSTGTLCAAWDGRNLLAYHGDADDRLRAVNPPVDQLCTAAAFRLLGRSDAAGHVPFALAGLAALILLFFVIRSELPDRPDLANYTVAALGLSVTFLLAIDTCRYYAFSMLFGLCVYLAYRALIRTQRVPAALGLAVALILLFFTNWLNCAAMMVSLLVVALAQDRPHLRPRTFALAGLSLMLLCLAAVPFVFHYQIWRFSEGPRDPWWMHYPTIIGWCLRDLNIINAVPWMLGVLIGVALWKLPQAEKSRPVADWGMRCALILVSYTITTALLSPQPTGAATIADVRYQFGSLPFAAALCAVALWYAHQWQPWAGVGLLALLISSNALTLTPLPETFPFTYEFRWLLPKYIAEATQNYPTSNEAVARYLLAHARQDDQVVVSPDYFKSPLLYYCGDRIKLTCQIDNPRPSLQAVVMRLNPALDIQNGNPDWIVQYGPGRQISQILTYYERPRLIDGKWRSRPYTLAATLDVYYKETQRPELPWHHFGPVTSFSRAGQAVTIYHGGQQAPARRPSGPVAPPQLL